MTFKLTSAIAVATAIAVASPAAATVFAGGSNGCFGASCTPAATATDAGLTYTAGTFSQTTDPSGFAAIGGTGNNFGTITLAPNSHSYTGDVFNLLISFTSPPGSGNGSFTANLMGSLTSFGTGGVQFTFLNPDQTIASSAGNFLLHVNNLSFSGSPPQNETVLRQDINGYIQAAVPEPATWAMMLLGFGGIGLAMRSRKRVASLRQIA